MEKKVFLIREDLDKFLIKKIAEYLPDAVADDEVSLSRYPNKMGMSEDDFKTLKMELAETVFDFDKVLERVTYSFQDYQGSMIFLEAINAFYFPVEVGNYQNLVAEEFARMRKTIEDLQKRVGDMGTVTGDIHQ
ncbi:MAG: hypothetical protein N4A44_03550 [Alphaproteobacteria bacterium]|jgi:hypothetical protein|nr:hypothetical protein [Alphaproteobacteria bacterium]